jgi:hypothetical protein
MTATVTVSVGAALEASEGNIVRFSKEIVRQLVARLDDSWQVEKLKLEPHVTEDGMFLTISDGLHRLTVKVELGAFSSGVMVVH